MHTRAIKGIIIYSKDCDTVSVTENGYIVVEGEKVEGIYKELPEKFNGIEIIDYTDKLIIPAFSDLHLHAGQYYQRGIGMDVKLIDWLNTYTFPQESNFKNMDYAREVYDKFVKELLSGGTLQASIFATIHYDATDYLFKKLENLGITSFVGKVNMNRNSPHFLSEETQDSRNDTERFILEHKGGKYAKPIITPRFVPSCTWELMEGLGELAKKYDTPVQSHLCESPEEIAWIKELHPESPNYASVYKETGLIGNSLSIMAHCVHMNDDEKKIMEETQTVAVHCPDSNINIRSGIMPVEEIMRSNIPVALGSDIGGGHDLPIYKVITKAIQSSKIKSFYEEGIKELTIENAFYIATKAGGKCFGDYGTFDKGYNFNALVIDDENLTGFDITPMQRIERFCYIGTNNNIVARYSHGNFINI